MGLEDILFKTTSDLLNIPTYEEKEVVVRKSYSPTQEQYEEAIKPYYLKAKKLEIGSYMAKNLATIQSMRDMVQGEPQDIITEATRRTTTETTERARDVTQDITYLAGREEILTSKVSGLQEEIYGLETALKEAERPIIQKSIFGDMDWLSGVGDALKGALPIIAIAIIGYALLRRK